MEVTIHPAPLRGSLPAVASKSEAHRALIAAALADRAGDIVLSSPADDIDATQESLRNMGAELSRLDARRWRMTPLWSHLPPAARLDCRESAATLRLLLPLAGLLCPQTTFSGRGRLAERPLAELCRQLARHGMCFSHPVLPFTVSGRLHGGTFTLPGDVSSQFISGLLLALPLLKGDSRIVLTTPLESAGYVDMTLDMLRRFAVSVEPAPDGWRIPGGQRYRSPGEIAVEGDWSGAACWLTAGALSGPITVSGLKPQSFQPDRRITALLRAAGAEAAVADDAVTVRAGRLQPFRVDAAATPDLVPVLAVLGLAAPGTTVITGAARLRLKESDRLRGLAESLSALGGHIRETGDGLMIAGGAPLAGGRADCRGDHRLAMALSLAALLCRQPVVIDGAEAVSKSYPQFWQDYRALGGIVDGI